MTAEVETPLTVESFKKAILPSIAHMFEMQSEQIGRLGKRVDLIDDKLAAMEKRFETIDSRFDEMDKRFETIDGRLDGIDARFVEVDGKFDGFKLYFDEKLRARDTIFDEKLKTLKISIVDEIKILMDNDKRMETAIEMGRANAENEIKLRDHSKRLSKLESEVSVIKKVVKEKQT